MTISFDLISLELAFVGATVAHSQDSMAFLEATQKTALIFSAIGPFLVTIAFLFILYPLASIGRAVCSEEDSLSVHIALQPFSFIHFSMGKNPPTVAVRKPSSPVTLEDRAIDVQLSASSVLDLRLPLPVVDSVFRGYWGSPFKGKGGGEFEGAQSRVDLSDCLGTLFGKVCIGTLCLLRDGSVIEKHDVNACLAVDCLAGLTVSHLNYNNLGKKGQFWD